MGVSGSNAVGLLLGPRFLAGTWVRYEGDPIVEGNGSRGEATRRSERATREGRE